MFSRPASYTYISQSAGVQLKMKQHQTTNSIATPLATLFDVFASLEGLIHKSTYMTVSGGQRFTERGAHHVS